MNPNKMNPAPSRAPRPRCRCTGTPVELPDGKLLRIMPDAEGGLGGPSYCTACGGEVPLEGRR